MKQVLFCCILTVMFLFSSCGNSAGVEYEGKTYMPVEYPANVFYYDYHGTDGYYFDEVDGIYPLETPNWDMIWNGGDLYCAKNQVKEAIDYYGDDENYDWYIIIDSDDEEVDEHPIELAEDELDAVYKVEDLERDQTAFFEEFEAMGSLNRISKDGVVDGVLSIAKYGGEWYWKSEVIDDTQEKDGTWPEYIQPLPSTLSDKIKRIELQ